MSIKSEEMHERFEELVETLKGLVEDPSATEEAITELTDEIRELGIAIMREELQPSDDSDFNFWREYAKSKNLGEIAPPYLDASGLEFDEEGYSGPDEYGSYVYKPWIDKRDEMEASGDRIERYAARMWKHFHFRYVVDGPGADLGEWEFQYAGRPLIMGWWQNGVGKNRWYPVPLHGDEGPYNVRVVYAGQARHRAREYFEAFVSDGLRRTANGWARQVLHKLDRAYADLESDEAKAEFVAAHPNYEPKEK